MARNLDDEIARRKLTNRVVAERIGATEHQVWRWRKGRHMPNLEALSALASLLFEGDISRLYVDREAA